MNLQSLVVVLLRLVSLNFLLQVAYQAAPLILRFSELYRQLSPDESRSSLMLPWVLELGLILGAVLVWVFAMPIARLVTRGLPPELSFGSLSLSDCYSITLIGLGLANIVNHFAAVLNWTHYLFRMAASDFGSTWKQEVKWYDVTQACLPFIIGIILFVNGRKWAVALARRQTQNEPPPAPSIPPERKEV